MSDFQRSSSMAYTRHKIKIVRIAFFEHFSYSFARWQHNCNYGSIWWFQKGWSETGLAKIKYPPVKLSTITSLHLGLFAWNFAHLLTICIHTYLIPIDSFNLICSKLALIVPKYPSLISSPVLNVHPETENAVYYLHFADEKSSILPGTSSAVAERTRDASCHWIFC